MMLHLIGHSLRMRKMQTLSALLSVVLCVAIVFATSMAFLGVKRGVEVSSERGGAQILVVPEAANEEIDDTALLFTGVPASIYLPASTVDKIAGMKGVTACTAQFYSQTLSEGCCSTDGETRLIGYDDETDFVISPLIEGGFKGKLSDDQAIVGSTIAVESNDTIRIVGKTYHVVGRMAETGSGLDTSIVVHIDQARAISASTPGFEHFWNKYGQPADLVSCIMVNTDPAEFRRVITMIGNISDVKAFERSSVVEDAQNQLESVFEILLVLVAIAVVGAILQLFARFYSMAFERKGELALYQAVGASERQLCALIGGEAAILTGAGLVAGFLAGAGVFAVLMNILRSNAAFPFLTPEPVIVVSLIIIVIVTFVLITAAAILAPLRQISRISPSTAMQQGDIN